MSKYEIVACVGDQYDYTYELVDVAYHWKDARDYALLGLRVYLNGKLLDNGRFIDHEAVKEAFETLKLNKIVGLNVYEDDPFEAEVKEKSADDVLKENGLVANEAWKVKVEKRYLDSLHRDPLEEPMYKRNIQFIPIYSADTHKLVRVINGRIDSDELPF